MKSFACFGRKLQHLCSGSLMHLDRFLVCRVNPFWIQLSYFLSVSSLGLLLLKFINARNTSFRPQDLDLFFMSVSATTVSSMGTVELEYFSNNQLIVFIILMILGGEVFTSMLGLQFMKAKLKKQDMINNKVESTSIELRTANSIDKDDQTELGLTVTNNHEYMSEIHSMGSGELKFSCLRYLSFVVLGYFVLVHVGGSCLILLYLGLVSSARDVLKNKKIQMQTFAVFTTVSTFSNCGFIPTNENMIIFKKNSGLLLMIAPLILCGNTLYPPCLRLVIWVLRRVTRRVEFDYILKNSGEIGYDHLLRSVHTVFLSVTVLGFILVQFVLFCSLEWHSDALRGLSSYQKMVGALFESVNSRHGGESMVDLSILSPAILVVYVVMMYLPPYTSFLPIEDADEVVQKRGGLTKSLILSQLSYLAIFTALICVTEREKMVQDPVNFSVLNIVIEVTSAYGNVGFSTGYSCERQLKPDSTCKDAWTGFAGRWSNQGKLILILVMLFGRLKKFSMKGGRAWKLN